MKLNRWRWPRAAAFSVLFCTSLVWIQTATANPPEAPVEHPEVAITRGPSSPQTLNAQLSRNVYRFVEREITEIVQVPYTVEVPYTDYETYYVDEQQCGYHPREVCHTRQRCDGPPRQVCREVRRCRYTPRGEVCSNERECHTEPAPCRNDRVCHIEQRYECRWVSVPRTRPVTRYRTETRYRPEERRRTVTDKIYDHHWNAQVAVTMPSDSGLQSGEQETVLIRLGENEQAPEAEVTVDSPIFNYQIVRQTRTARRIQVTLGLKAKYSPEDLSEATIQGLMMARTTAGVHQIQFADQGVVARTTTRYQVQVFDKDTGKWIFSANGTGSFGNRMVVIPVSAAVAADHDHMIRLSVQREGKVISAPVRFQKDAHQVGQLNPGPYVDPNGVREFSMQGSGPNAELVFTDATPNDGKVETRYEIEIQRRGWVLFWEIPWWKIPLGNASLNRTQLRQDANGKVIISMASLPGIDADEIRYHFEQGDEIYVELRVHRVSPRLGGASPVQFEKEAKVRIQ